MSGRVGHPGKAVLVNRSERREMSRHEHAIILAARESLVGMIERYCAGAAGLDPRILRVVAVTGLFADTVAGLVTSTAAAQLLAAINQQLAGAGLQVVPVKRN